MTPPTESFSFRLNPETPIHDAREGVHNRYTGEVERHLDPLSGIENKRPERVGEEIVGEWLDWREGGFQWQRFRPVHPDSSGAFDRAYAGGAVDGGGRSHGHHNRTIGRA